MNRILISVLVALSAFYGSCTANEKTVLGQRFFDLNQGSETTFSQALPRLRESRIVLVGEHHTDERHHWAQLQVIRRLHDAGVKVAVGMEMFRRDSQDDLDRWVSGELDESAFEKIYADNWTFPYSLYAPILRYARENRIPVVGLNVPSDITRQVARMGYKSLSEVQRNQLGDVSCRVDKDYMDFIRKAFGAHAHGDLNFIYFCEAQMVWDAVMAVTALDYLSQKPDTLMVILAGTGHVRKQAIPAQIRDRATIPVSVILPEVPDMIERNTVDRQDADYIFLDTGGGR